jgi:hypothetical protein
MTEAKVWRVVVVYDDPRGGIWRGPLEDRASAEARLAREAARVRGSARLETLFELRSLDT